MINVQIRELETLEEFQRCVDIQKEVWGFDDPYDVVPLPLLVVSKRTDGIVLGAFLPEGTMIGFVYSLPGTHHGKKLQWSHMLAVTPPYRDSDIGYQLKMEQYRISTRMGMDMVEWTYDPLESRNANFNLRKLGCIVEEYEINVYGITSSPLHSGMPTDRFIAHWPIPPLEKSLPEFKVLPEPPALITATRRMGPDAVLLEDYRLNAEEPILFVEIPVNMQGLKAYDSGAALQWRLKTREIFTHYFARGYIACSFLHWKQSDPPRSFYVLKKT